MNIHDLASDWLIAQRQARRGEISGAALASIGRKLIASASIIDLKSQRYLDAVVKPDVLALESSRSPQLQPRRRAPLQSSLPNSSARSPHACKPTPCANGEPK